MTSNTKKDLINILYHYGIRNLPIGGISVATMVHEYGHLICSKILGFNGYIKSGKLTSVYYEIRPNDSQWTLFYLSGGLLQFIIFMLMSLRASDKNVKIANRMTAIIGLIEGLVEPMRYFRLTGLGATIGIIASFLYLTYQIVKETRK